MQNKRINNSLRIAIVWEQTEWGGVDSYLAYLLNSWPEAYDDIVVFHNAKNKGAERLKTLISTKANIRFEQVPTSNPAQQASGTIAIISRIANYLLVPLLFLRSARRYRQLFAQNKFDVVLGQNGGYPGSYGVISSMFGASAAGVPVRSLVIHHAATKPNLFHGWFRLLIEKRLGSILSSLITVSKATRDSVKANTIIFDDQKCHATVINDGIPAPKTTQKTNMFRDDRICIGLLGRLEAYKGHDDFLSAVALLPENIRMQISVEIIGGYSEQDGNRLKTIIENLDIADVVNIHGYVDAPTSEIILSLDLVAMMTKTFEGFGLTVIEALLCNVPVISTKQGIVPEIIPESNPLLVEVGEIDAIAQALEMFVMAENRQVFIDDVIRDNLWRYEASYMAKHYRQHLLFEYLKVARIKDYE
jgi:glycosyltransferase involved in cell wall biosynthesis